MSYTKIEGNLTKDATLYTNDKGKKTLFVRVAVNNGKDSKGEDREASYYDLAVNGDDRIAAAEAVLKKGVAVSLSASVYARIGKDKDGNAVAELAGNIVYGDVLAFNGKGEKPTASSIFPKKEEVAA